MAKIPSAEAREQLEEKTFDRVLDIITQTSLHRRSPKLFIIYAHSNESLGINAHQDVVKGYISWFKKILFNVDSDKSPHGYGPVMETAHDGASNDIITNQLCLLPTSWDKRNVDYVLVFYSKLLARYMKYEREYSIQIDNQPSRTYSEALFEACNKYNGQNQDRSQKAYENDIRHLQKAYREKMGSEFHHVLTELALLRFRNRGKVPCYTVPIILFEDEKWDHEDKWDANFVEMSETELRVPVKFRELYQSFLKILLRFEPLEGDRPLIEAFLKCFETSVAKLKTSAMNATEYQTYFDVNVSKALRRLQDGTEYRMERPLTIGGVRDVLNVRALDHTFLKRVSGEDISWDLNDIDLEISERPGLENRKSRANRENENAGDGKISLHSLFNKRELEDIKEIRPNRIFIRGKPGVGKSVLCRRIMYEYSWHQMLRSRFELVILIPVRKLDIKDFSRILFEEYFRAVVKGREMSEFLKNLILEARELQKHKILVVLDGLDEARGWDREKRALLEKLLKLPTVLVTSRVTDDANNIPFDLWVNAVGLSMENVKAYLNNRAIIPTSTTARAIERFIGDYPAVREISQVPIYLDIICSSWDELSGRVPRSTALLEPRHNEQPTITSLYQGVVRSLWRKDIPLLHKFDNGELVDNEIVMAVRDFGRVERLVEPEIMVLEQIAITMMKENKLEFTEQDVADAIFLLESTHGPIPLTLERNLRKLSILRSSSTYSQRRYHFVHLTFQEYFAAKYVAHDPGRIKAYLKSYKYHPRFEMLWRFVPGLLSDPTPFFNFIEEEPLDLLGLTHERLVMHCLSEVDASTELPIRRDLKKRLTQWLLFECHFTGSSLLARDSQFPDEALSTALEIASSPERSKIRTGILEALQHSRAKFSDKTISALTALFKDNKSSVRSAAASALRGQATLSDAVILDLVAMLKDRDWNVRSAAAETLGGRANLSEAVVSAIVALLTDNDSNIQSAAAGAMRRQANLSETTVLTLIALLKDKNLDVQHFAAEAIKGQANLSKNTVSALIALLKDENWSIQFVAASALSGQANLSEAVVLALIELLEDKHWRVQNAATQALKLQANLSKNTVSALIALLKDKNWSVQSAAARALGGQANLSETTVSALVALMKDKNWPVQSAAAESLGNQANLSKATVSALVELLKSKVLHVQSAAASALGGQANLSENAVFAFVGLLTNENWTIQTTAAQAIKRQTNLPETAVWTLAALLKHGASSVRSAAASALGGQANLSETAVSALVAMLEDEIWGFRSAAVSALGGQANLSDTTVSALRALLRVQSENAGSALLEDNDKDEPVRFEAARTLGSQTNLSDNILKAIGLLLESERSDERPNETKHATLRDVRSVESWYGSWLYRSFKEQFSLYVDDSNCVINQSSGLRTASLDDYSGFLYAVSKGRQLWNISGYNLWGDLEVEPAKDYLGTRPPA